MYLQNCALHGIVKVECGYHIIYLSYRYYTLNWWLLITMTTIHRKKLICFTRLMQTETFIITSWPSQLLAREKETRFNNYQLEDLDFSRRLRGHHWLSEFFLRWFLKKLNYHNIFVSIEVFRSFWSLNP